MRTQHTFGWASTDGDTELDLLTLTERADTALRDRKPWARADPRRGVRSRGRQPVTRDPGPLHAWADIVAAPAGPTP